MTEQKNVTSDRKRLALVMMLAASICFSTGGLFMKLIPWNPLAINGARNLIACVVIGIYLIVIKHKLVINPTVLIGALCMAGVTTGYAVANKLTTAANAIVLQFTAPVFVILEMAAIYHVKPKRLDIITCAAVLTGVVLFFVDGIRAGNWLGNLTAVLSGVCYAGVFMMNTGERADALSSSFLGQLAAGVILTPLCAGETDFSAPTMAAVLALGVIQVGGAYILFSEGIKRTPAVTASLITGMEPILNPLWVAAFYGERVTPLSVM
jgi:drug/metabolite transporter (DMT)-like permease